MIDLIHKFHLDCKSYLTSPNTIVPLRSKAIFELFYDGILCDKEAFC